MRGFATGGVEAVVLAVIGVVSVVGGQLGDDLLLGRRHHQRRRLLRGADGRAQAAAEARAGLQLLHAGREGAAD